MTWMEHTAITAWKTCNRHDRHTATDRRLPVDVFSQQWVCRSGGYLLEALLHLQELSVLFTRSNLRHILLLIDPVPPVLLAALLQQGHSEGGEKAEGGKVKFNKVHNGGENTAHAQDLTQTLTHMTENQKNIIKTKMLIQNKIVLTLNLLNHNENFWELTWKCSWASMFPNLVKNI